MTNEEILANAPEGATHFDGNTYFRFEMYEHGQAYLIEKSKGYWDRGLPAYPVYGCRALSDIRRIVELEKYNLGLATESHELQQKLEAAERERDDYKRIAIDAATESFLIAADNEIKRALAQENKSASAINHCQHQFHRAARSCAINCVNNQLHQQLNGGE